MALHPKVQAASGAAALSVVLVFIAQQAGLTIPPDVASAITALLTIAAGYLKAA